MTYLYESTSPERFQQFCQALLIPEYPGLQCFPVGQPDGGRDAWHPDSKTILQVKFRRTDEEQSAEWMIATLEHELPKIKRLVNSGASNYVMLTNARGTAHPTVGRIDLVQKWLADNVPCPAMCMWRDELDRRFDSAPPSLKFRYPELLTGRDGFELALAQVLGPLRERQMRVVRAFVGSQFDSDSKVKFKQVSLSNDLVDLFIDIPIRASENLLKQVNRKQQPDIAYRILRELEPTADEIFAAAGSSFAQHRYRTRVGAAAFLIGRSAQEYLTRIVLEGAPGQGKSTLAQFVCQVHRATLLDRTSFLTSIPLHYRRASLRLPIKIDLRDLAEFISARDEPAMASFDEFVSDLIYRESGCQSFSVDDLLDILTRTPTLLFLDGLDEVADLELRHVLINVVQKALSRYETLGVDLQVVVTSRPSVFGQKANFDASGFVTIDLASINKPLVMDYSKKWVKARALDEADANEVLSILSDKMQMPHIVELTRNPMQLTILLSLIHQIGYSLPDQRTDLYRRYLELFLIRESEKTPTVKKYSAVLVSFIQHLAWVLQSRAESAGSRGSISEHDLQEMARAYLRDAKQSVELADDLFGGGLERIFVLVQRVSGLYEFEVQPLREFFCARHLYETSPVGTYRYQSPRGDRAQRFEALARNPFWLNVTRFYAGSYEPGEIGSLVLSLKEIIADADTAVSLHGRRVAFALISDWVFANKKSWQDELLLAACDSVGLDLLIQQASADGDLLVLDEDCGQATLRKLVFAELLHLPQVRQAYAFCALLDGNGGKELTDDFLGALDGKSGPDRSSLLTRMILSGAADPMQINEVVELVNADAPSLSQLRERLSIVVGRFSPTIQSDEQAMQAIVAHALEGEIGRGSPHSLLSVFVDLLSAKPTSALFLDAQRVASFFEDAANVEAYRAPACRLPQFMRRVTMDVDDSVSSLRPSFAYYQILCDSLCEIFGGQPWAAYVAAIRSAGMPTSDDVRFANRMFDESLSLAARARYARLKRGSAQWWLDQLDEAGNGVDRRIFWAVLVMTWTSPRTFEVLRPEVEAIVDGLTSEEADRMAVVVRIVNRDTKPRKNREGYRPDLAGSSDRFVYMAVLSFRLQPADVAAEVSRRDSLFLARWLDERRTVEALDRVLPKNAKSIAILGWLKKVCSAQHAGIGLPFRIIDRCRDEKLDARLARKIASAPSGLPREAVAHARDIVMGEYSPETLTSASTRQDWSFE